MQRFREPKLRPRKEELKALKTLVGGWAFRALTKGRPLRLWRRSSPHNWFITDAKDVNTLWHSGEGRDRQIPNLRLFRRKDSGEIIDTYGFPCSDNGRPESSEFYLKPEYRVIAD